MRASSTLRQTGISHSSLLERGGDRNLFPTVEFVLHAGELVAQSIKADLAERGPGLTKQASEAALASVIRVPILPWVEAIRGLLRKLGFQHVGRQFIMANKLTACNVGVLGRAGAANQVAGSGLQSGPGG